MNLAYKTIMNVTPKHIELAIAKANAKIQEQPSFECSNFEIKPCTLGDAKLTEQWPNNKFGWVRALRRDEDLSNTFYLSLQSNGKILGIAASHLIEADWDDMNTNPYISLLQIERSNKASFPCKGFAIASFSEVNFQLAQNMKVSRIGVNMPVPATKKIYTNLGFKEHSPHIRPEMALDISQSTSLQWKNLEKF